MGRNPNFEKLNKQDIDRRSENWGKTKFKPKTYAERNNALEPQQDAMPWKHVKSNIMSDEREQHNEGNINMKSDEAKLFLKKRNENFRRNLIEAKRNEPTKWETFSDEEAGHEPNNKIFLGNGSKPGLMNDKHKEATKFKKFRCNDDKPVLAKDKRNKANKWRTFADDAGAKVKPSQNISHNNPFKPQEDQLVNGNLTAADRNYFRKKITKVTLRVKGTSLDAVINDLKRRGVKRGRNE